MNIAMEQTEEYVNGQLKNKYGDAFIRGNNGEMLLSSAPPLNLRSICFGLLFLPSVTILPVPVNFF
jgi:hypothetical protein